MIRYIFLVLSLALFAEVGSAQSNSENRGPEAERPKPVVNVQEQPGAPLKITATTKWTNPEAIMLEIYVVVENVSELEIRSYTWRLAPTDGSQNKDSCFSQSSQLLGGKILQPGDSDGKSTWRHFPLDSPAPNFDLSLDFVEFGNNSTWGSDTCKSLKG